ncbi:MAG: hypothetical protein ACYC63_13330 [Armatimonadota bacterium]
MLRHLIVPIMLAAASAALAAPTTAPLTYILDYGPKHLGNEQWMADTVAAGPQLLHLGKDVPMSHLWGPIQSLGGENQAYGKGEHIRRLSPAEVRTRMADLKAMVSRLHEGSPLVMPYICAMTIGGDPVKRTGFWEFYDHWNDYAEFGLGQRPAEDPRTWFQVRPDGSPHFFYALTNGKYPPFEPNLRYAVCMNNPNWRYWSEQVVRLVAEVGYDGVFVDNGSSQRCYCHYCQDGFRTWLAGRYQPAALETLFGQGDVAKLGLGDNAASDLLAAETRRFWIDSYRRHHLALKAAGEKVRKPFYIFPNGGEHRPENVQLGFPEIDFVMFERSFGEWGTNPGRVERRIIRDIKLRHYNDNVFENKLTQTVGGLVRPILLTRGGYPQEPPEMRLNTATAETGMAEMAAFSNGGGFLLRPLYDQYGDVMRKWRKFTEAHADLYRDKEPYAQVGIVCFPQQNLYRNATHIARVKSLTAALADCHVLFDYVLEDQVTPENLRKYALLLVPDVPVMSVAQAQAIKDYRAGGGQTVLIGNNAQADERLQPYPQPALGDCDLPQPPTSAGMWDLLGQRKLQSLALLPPRSNDRTWFNAFASPDGRTVYLHVVNYDMLLGREASPVDEKADLQVTPPLPAGMRLADALVYDPQQSEPTKLTPRQGRLSLPPLHAYQLVVIRLAAQ